MFGAYALHTAWGEDDLLVVLEEDFGEAAIIELQRVE